jgi:hypothetical protein
MDQINSQLESKSRTFIDDKPNFDINIVSPQNDYRAYSRLEDKSGFLNPKSHDRSSLERS